MVYKEGEGCRMRRSVFGSSRCAGPVPGVCESSMPRPTKAFRRHKINAAIAFKRGEKKEAYDLWAKADKSLKEHREKKCHKKKKAAEAVAAEAAAKATESTE